MTRIQPFSAFLAKPHIASDFSIIHYLFWGCLQEDPEALKPKLEDLLRKHDVEYKYSTTTKFANFVNRTLE